VWAESEGRFGSHRQFYLPYDLSGHAITLTGLFIFTTALRAILRIGGKGRCGGR
jgi:hypothetical protein